MKNRDKCIVRVAREWIGTPYRHQGSAKHHGCDCLGLLRGVWREVVGPEPEAVPQYTPDWSEAGAEERLWRAAARNMCGVKIDPAKDGQIVLFRMRSGHVAKHLGILAHSDCGQETIIHAYNKHGVVETPLTKTWKRKIVAQFLFPKRSM